MDQDIPIMVSQSFAANFGLYGDSVGAVHFVCRDIDEATHVESNAKIVARAIYSNPPIHGSKIVTNILTDLSF